MDEPAPHMGALPLEYQSVHDNPWPVILRMLAKVAILVAIGRIVPAGSRVFFGTYAGSMRFGFPIEAVFGGLSAFPIVIVGISSMVAAIGILREQEWGVKALRITEIVSLCLQGLAVISWNLSALARSNRLGELFSMVLNVAAVLPSVAFSLLALALIGVRNKSVR